MSVEPVIVIGKLGWANANRTTQASLDAYGPGGRWGDYGTGHRRETGDMLADALVREDIGEGATLIVVAIDRPATKAEREAVEAAVRAAVAGIGAQP